MAIDISHSRPSSSSNDVVRKHTVAMIYALAARLEANADLDPLSGLGALVLRGQGDAEELDDAQRALVRALTLDVVDVTLRGAQ